jgi:hypothetical protein
MMNWLRTISEWLWHYKHWPVRYYHRRISMNVKLLFFLKLGFFCKLIIFVYPCQNISFPPDEILLCGQLWRLQSQKWTEGNKTAPDACCVLEDDVAKFQPKFRNCPYNPSHSNSYWKKVWPCSASTIHLYHLLKIAKMWGDKTQLNFTGKHHSLHAHASPSISQNCWSRS